MTSYWPFWLGGPALAVVAVIHWWMSGRMLSVSGRYTALVNRIRGKGAAPPPPATLDELTAALRAATMEEFGEEAIPGDAPSPPPPPAHDVVGVRPTWEHAAFLGSLVLGGVVSAALGGGETFQAGPATSSASWLVLGVGGVLVGAGTRMAGGCTSGHGLCGVSRLRPASLVATAAFFGLGIATSLILERLC